MASPMRMVRMKNASSFQSISHSQTHRTIAEIQTHKFAFIMANYFYKDANRNYIPAEIAATAFNFKSGILKSHHTYINPGMYAL